MRSSVCPAVVAAAVLLVCAAPLPAGPATPCVVADATCKESFAAGAFNFWYFRNYSLQTPNANIQRAVIVVHGLQRNAPDYFAAALTALQGDTDPSILVIVPHFKGFVRGSATCADSTEPGELHWSCEGQGSINRWDDGGQARDTGGDVIFSFSMIDHLVAILNDPSLFPNLAKITIAGHSDGGQLTQRYAAGNPLDGTIAADVKYVIANPGSYMYLDNQRLPKGETCFEDGTCTADFTADWDPGLECPGSYSTYKYGLDGRTFGYMDSAQPGFSDAELAAQFLARNVAYLVGEQDQLDNSQFDASCPANAQGSHLEGDGVIGGRRERGTIFWNRMQQLGAAHTLAVVPGCGHDEVCMLSSVEMVQAILY